MLIKSIQNKKVLETLQNNKTHIAENTKVTNLIKPYETMRKYYGWKNTPVFGCLVGRYCEFYGAATDDTVILTLNVPDEFVKLQVYYDWTDVIYYTEFTNEWECGSFDEFVANVLNGVGTDDERAIIQVTMPFIKPEWLVSYEPITNEFIDNHVGSGGSSILE